MGNIIWKSHPRYIGIIEISNTGIVRSLDRKDVKGRFVKGKIRKLQKSNKGYLSVCLTKNKEEKNEWVHRLVSETFIPNPENKPYVNHKNGVKTDNRVKNLEWVTASENMEHSVRNRLTTNIGLTHVGARFNKEQVQYIYKSNLFLHELSKMFNVSIRTITNIRNDVSYKSVTSKLKKGKAIRRCSKKVYKIDINGKRVATFDSISEAAQACSANRNHFAKSVKNSQRNYYKGFIYKIVA